MIYPRWQIDPLKKALTARRVVIISGPRQCGKTTLARQITGSDVNYRTLDNEDHLKVATTDPLGFLKHERGVMIIDEAQKAPFLIPAIKMVVDENPAPGQFLLTGSADIQKHPAVTESLAGRVKHIRLRSLSQGEIMGKPPSFLERAFAHDFPLQIRGFDKEAIIRRAFIGGYPEATFIEDPLGRKDWFLDYAETMLERDLKDIANIRRKDSLRILLHTFAAWSSKLMDLSGIGAYMELNRRTLSSYANVLEALYLFQRIPAWTQTDYQRVGLKEKIFITDTGLMAALLDWRADEVLLDADRSGKLIETLVFNELAIQTSLGRENVLYHYRDRQQHEIDFIVQNSRGNILGIEVKAGSRVSLKEDARHLRFFKNQLAPNQTFTGIVLYTGQDALPLEENIFAVPLACLWQ
ncbi:MAG: ATP-binding protein [Synergistaceae bacterium]|jgi:predicted AAA+ superfamily ATPase|nr:ATP-binding protein [Synergistaceae bacterium]